MTALPHPAKVSQKVPIASAAYFLAFKVLSCGVESGVNREAGGMVNILPSVNSITGAPALHLLCGKDFVNMPDQFD